MKASFAAALVLTPLSAAAQSDTANYPSRPIRIVVPQSPGASTDLTARLIAQKLTEAFRQTVVVDNRPGAGTISGTEIVTKAAPDGHTLLVVASSLTINPSLYTKLPYDPVRDFTPVTQLSKFPNLIAANPSFAAKTLNDLIALAKAKPGTINYASAGTGTGTHMSAELLKQMTGIDIVQIPYKGGGPAAIAAIGGQTQMIIGTSVGLLPHVRSGKLRAIAMTSPKRSAIAPEIPVVAESVPGYDHEPWNGLLAPAKTPMPIIAKLNTEVARILSTPDVKKIFSNEGAEAVGNSPEAFAAIVKAETAKWAKVVKTAGIRID
ncbi:MAG: tripartite tricarboxylate transporter substrate binding protein [Burkholderiales bacterium]